MSLINQFLDTGRILAKAEAAVFALPVDSPTRSTLSREATRLQHQQTGEIAAALRAGVDLDTIQFALALHGQGADRDPTGRRETPAKLLTDLIQQHGGERVIEALDAIRKTRP